MIEYYPIVIIIEPAPSIQEKCIWKREDLQFSGPKGLQQGHGCYLLSEWQPNCGSQLVS